MSNLYRLQLTGEQIDKALLKIFENKLFTSGDGILIEPDSLTPDINSIKINPEYFSTINGHSILGGGNLDIEIDKTGLATDEELNALDLRVTSSIGELSTTVSNNSAKILELDTEINTNIPNEYLMKSNLESESISKGFIKSDVANLSNYYDKTNIDNKISKLPKFAIQVVSDLPVENISETTIYLLANPKGEVKNLYDEYIYQNSKWELIGSQINALIQLPEIELRILTSELSQGTYILTAEAEDIEKIYLNKNSIIKLDLEKILNTENINTKFVYGRLNYSFNNELSYYGDIKIGNTLKQFILNISKSEASSVIQFLVLDGYKLSIAADQNLVKLFYGQENINASTIEFKTINGQSILTAGNIDLATTENLSAKVEKVSEVEKVYATDMSGNQSSIDYSSSMKVNSLAKRNATGQIKISAPIETDDAATKEYVDNAILVAIGNALKEAY